MIKDIYYYFLILFSGLFDKEFYLKTYQDVRIADIDPLWHFIKFGWKEEKNPSADFNTKHYLDSNPDVRRSGINPLLHYIKHGQNENRRLKPSHIEKHGNANLSLETLLYENAAEPPGMIDIIIFPIIPWDFRFQRPQQIALKLSDLGHRIFYIDTNFCLGTQPKIHKIRENIYSVRLSNNNQRCQFNTSLSEKDVSNLQASIQTLRDILLINSAAMIVDLPFWVDLVKNLKISHGWKLVYDCMDFHLGFSNHSHKAEIDEKNLIESSDLIFATSHYLLNHVKKINQNCIIVSNGTDFESFHKATVPTTINEIKDVSPPIIGYYGAIADWFNTHLVASLAIEKPNWSFLLIGDTFLADIEPFDGLKNVYLLGEKPISEIKDYLSNFDVCLIPFKDIPLTNATNPVKMYEYLSAGKPIVATRLDELSYYKDHLKLAKTKQEWIEAIKNSLSEIKTDELLNKRFNFAKENTWQTKAKRIQTEIFKLYPKVSVIVVSYKNLVYTRLCLESILKNTNYPNYELIIVDNASDQNTVNFLKDFCLKNDIDKLILNQANLSFSKANNQGAKISNGEYLVFLNNDTIVSPGWIHRLLWHLTSSEIIGMVGPVTNAISNEAKINIDYSDATIFNVNNFAAKHTMMNYGQSFEIKVLALFCAMISKELFFEVDGLDEQYKIGMFEDDDLATKIHKKGLKLACAKDVFIHHVQKASFNLFSDEEYKEIFFENKVKFEKKWNITWTQHNTERNGENKFSFEESVIDYTIKEFQEQIISNISNYKGVFIQEPNIYWDIPLYQRPQHIATSLGKLGYLVIYRIPSPMESGKGLRQVSKNVWVTHAEIDNINNFVSSIYSTAFPSVDYLLGKKKSGNEILVYEYIDHITPNISVDIETVNRLMKLKEFAFDNADFIIASARVLEQEAISEVGKEKVLYIPNGVDVDHYRSEKHKKTILPDILLNFRDRYNILVGYFGAISPWLWYEMLTKLIEMRDDIGFLFIGPDYQNSYFNLPKSSNLLHLDAVNYKILPGYARIFDICFIPFAPGDIAKSTSPLKLFEYFALEKPVVVPSFMDECVAFDEVFTGESATSLSEAIDAATAIKNDPDYKNKLAWLADRNSWLQRAKEYTKIFNFLNKNS